MFTRIDARTWNVRAHGPAEVAPLITLGVELAVDEVYRKVFEDPSG